MKEWMNLFKANVGLVIDEDLVSSYICNNIEPLCNRLNKSVISDIEPCVSFILPLANVFVVYRNMHLSLSVCASVCLSVFVVCVCEDERELKTIVKPQINHT